MQRILVKQRDPKTGEEKMVPFSVLRSWSQAGKGDIFLFKGGDYGYRNGDPVRTRQELEEVIADSGQRRQALNWWDRKGKAKSSRHYDELAARMDRRAELSQRAAEGAEGENLESKLYRISVEGKVTDEAAGWADAGFSRMPEWWGAAEMIKVGDTLYESIEALENEATRKAADAGRKSVPKPGAKKADKAEAEEL